MPKTTAIGTFLEIEDPTSTEATPVWNRVGNLTSIGVPSPTKTDVDVTDFDSEAMEYLPGLTDNGELPMSGRFNYTDVGQKQMYEDAHNPDAGLVRLRVNFPQQSVRFVFSAYVKSFQPTAGGPNEPYNFDAAVRISGAVADEPIA